MSAIDIVAVRQPDGTIKCTSFQVLFSSKRSSEMVQVEVNGELISSCTMVAHQSGQVCFSPEVPTRKPHKIIHNEKTKQLSLVTLEDVVDEGCFELKELSGIVKQGSVTLDEPKLPKCVNNVQNNPKRVKKSGSLGSLLSAMKAEKKKPNNVMSSSTPNAIRKSPSSADLKEENSIVLSKVPTSTQLSQMNLKDGINEVRYRTVVTNQVATARLYLWNPETKIVISDVDGTITKSDKRGLFYYKLGYDWTHDSVVSLYSNLVSHGYQIVYVTARSVKTAVTTRAFLDKIKAPHGPIFTAPHNYLGCVTTELWKLTDQVKLAHLTALRSLFPEYENPFVAGFGNASHDEKCYREIKIDPSRIYIINRSSEVNVNNSKTKYCELMAAIHTLFPPISPVPQIQDIVHDASEDLLISEQPPLIQID